MKETELKLLFDDFGDIINVKIILDRESGISKGYGFIAFDDHPGAVLAIREMNGAKVEGRTLHVRLADEGSSTTTDASVRGNLSEQGEHKRKKFRAKRPRLQRS